MCVILILSMAIHAFALEGSTTHQSQGRALRTVIQVVVDPCTMPLNFKTVKALLLSTPTLDGASVDLERCVSLETLSTVDQSPLLLSLAIRVPSGNTEIPVRVLTRMIEGLRENLSTLHRAQLRDLDSRLTEAMQARAVAEQKVTDALRMSRPKANARIQYDPADQQVYEQLQAVVDLSSLRPETKVSEAFDLLRHAVEPPINIVVMW